MILKLSFLFVFSILCNFSNAESTAIIGCSAASSYTDKDEFLSLYGRGSALSGFLPPNVKVFNFAKPGVSSKSFYIKGRWDRVVSNKCEVVFTNFGLNDMPGKGERSANPSGDFAMYIKYYILESRRLGAIHVIVTPVERDNFNGVLVKKSMPDYVCTLKRVALENIVNLTYFNNYSYLNYHFLGKDLSQRLSPAKNDRVHLNKFVSMLIESFVFVELKNIFPQMFLGA